MAQQIVPLPRLIGGIQRLDERAQEGQVSDALNVVSFDGSLRRRPGMRSFAHGPMLHLPAGATMVAAEDAQGGYVLRDDRAGGIFEGNAGEPIVAIIVGALEEFDGIDFRSFLDAGPQTLTAAARLKLEYRNGESGWTEAPWVLDQTQTQGLDEGVPTSNFKQPMMRDGSIAWHRSQFTGWTAGDLPGAIFGRNLYMVRLSMVDIDGAVIERDTNDLEVHAPGLRAFQLSAINGIVAAQLGDGRRSLVVGGDREGRAPREAGAQLGVVLRNVITENLILVGDEGAGVFGVYTWPLWRYRALTDTSYVEEAAKASPTTGTANMLTKGDSSYDWTLHQWGGVNGRVIATGARTAATTTDLTFDLDDTAERDFEHHRLLCTTSGGGATAGDLKEIVRNYADGVDPTLTHIEVTPAFPSAPNATARFAIYAPPRVLRADEYFLKEWPIRTNTAQTLTPEAETFSGEVADIDAGCQFNWQIGSELRWTMKAGKRWISAFDPRTRCALLSNGEGPPLLWDGERLRLLEADSTSGWADTIVGAIPDADAINAPGSDPSSSLMLWKQPPRGQFLHVFQNRILVGPVEGADRDFCYSEGGPAGFLNRIWPKVNRCSVRDRANLPLKGFFTINGRCFATTSASIHEVYAERTPAREVLATTPRVEGVGFPSQAAIGVLPRGGAEFAIGPTALGLGIFDGSSMQFLISDWRQVFDGGINASALEGAVAAVVRDLNAYVVAIAPKGSQKNTRVLWVDISTGAIWPWEFPWAITALETRITDNGEEVLLLGTEDGFVATLGEHTLDDSETVTGYVKTAPMRAFGPRETLVSAAVLTAREGGRQQGLEITPYVAHGPAQSESPRTTKITPPLREDGAEGEIQQATWGDTGYPSVEFGTALFSRRRIVTVRHELGPALRAHILQFKISGTWLWDLHSIELICSSLGIQGRP